MKFAFVGCSCYFQRKCDVRLHSNKDHLTFNTTCISLIPYQRSVNLLQLTKVSRSSDLFFYLRSCERSLLLLLGFDINEYCCYIVHCMFNACPYFPHGSVFYCFQVMIFLYHSCFMKSQCLKKEKKKRRKKKRYRFMYFFCKKSAMVASFHPSFLIKLS